jgi:hypothetical protein
MLNLLGNGPFYSIKENPSSSRGKKPLVVAAAQLIRGLPLAACSCRTHAACGQTPHF